MRNTIFIAVIAFFAIAAGSIYSFSDDKKPPAPAGVAVDPDLLKAFGALPDAFENASNPLTEDKIQLGRMLYFEKRLSKNHDVSCNTCHNLETYGVDNKPVSSGHKKQKGDRNSPTVYNSAGQFVQFWDGRSPDVEDQAKGPILNPVEMAMAESGDVLAVLKSMPEYVMLFKKTFPDDKEPVTYDNLGKAIGAFERKLVTPSRWDRFVKGDASALTDEEKKGFNTFVSVGCVTCHAGTNLGGNLYQKVGLVKPWADVKDPGRAKVTKSDGDLHLFKVPILRNIDKTGPYLHDGSVADLSEMVKLMGRHQLGKELSDAETASILAWMKTLTGEINKDYTKEPTLPKSTAKTPKANPN